MKGSEWAKSLPEKDIAARDAAIFDAVRAGHYVVTWVPIYITSGSTSVVLMVSNDTLKIGERSDAVRINCTQRTSQLIADYLGCILPTAKLSDQIWQQADLKLSGLAQSWYGDGPDGRGTMSFTSRMIDFDRIVNSKIARRPYTSVAGHYKDWINTSYVGTPSNLKISEDGKTPAGCNYGFHNTRPAIPKEKQKILGVNSPSQTIPGVQVQQPPGIVHSYINHADYSQMLRLVKRLCIVCSPSAIAGLGQESYGAGAPCPIPGGGIGTTSLIDTYALITKGGDFTKLLSHEGQILLRHPAMGGQPSISDPASCSSLVEGACEWIPKDGQQEAPATEGPSQARALAWLLAGGVGGYFLVRSVPSLVKRFS